jgi:hypothetical protein
MTSFSNLSSAAWSAGPPDAERRHRDVLPAVGGENGGVHILVEAAEFEDAHIGLGGVLQAVVGDRQADLLVEHVLGARAIEALAELLEGRHGRARDPLWERERLKTVARRVPQHGSDG